MFPKFSLIRQEARASLSGVWGSAFLREFIKSLLGGGSTVITCIASLLYALYALVISRILPGANALTTSIGKRVALIIIVFAIVEFFRILIRCGMQIAVDRYYIDLIEKPYENPEDPLFGHISYFANRFFMEFKRDVATWFLSLFLLIPGIIASLKWSMAGYIMSADLSVTASDALVESGQMMEGYKMKLFLFQLSFLPHFLFSILTFGIGLIWVIPYYCASMVRFYLYVKNPDWQNVENKDDLITLHAEKFSYHDFIDEYESKSKKN